MSAGRCYIFGAGERTGDWLFPGEHDLIIAADGGLTWLQDMGVTPQLVVGDFDSLGIVPEGASVLRLPCEKDETDTMAAVRLGLERGYRSFSIYGGTGGRFDHTLANLQLLGWLSRRGCEGLLCGSDWLAAAITCGELHFPAESRGIISVFAQGGAATGVYLEGLKYPLTDAVLHCDVPMGVSNEFTGLPSRVAVGAGTLLVVWERPAMSAK